jgi:predicted branched-subunit amino acid permease
MSSDAASLKSAGFWQGVRLATPAVVALVPFGILFGAIAVDNGFSLFEAVLMSATVFGGASQMVGIELFGHHVQPWLIVLSIFAVNFRHILYSAAIGRRLSHWSAAKQAVAYFLLTDPQYALAESEAQSGRKIGFGWYLGAGLAVYTAWVVLSGLGAFFGNMIPNLSALGVDFLLPIYFLGLVMDFRKRPLWLPIVTVSAIASIIAYQTVGSPWHVSLGALAGVVLAVALPPARSGVGRPAEDAA